jgi:hypothetical protein
MENRLRMSAPLRGVLSGLAFGALSVGMMLPMKFPDKPAALLGAFLNRFGVGLVIGCVRLPWPGSAVGLFFGLLLSLPDASLPEPMLRFWFLAARAGWSSAG